LHLSLPLTPPACLQDVPLSFPPSSDSTCYPFDLDYDFTNLVNENWSRLELSQLNRFILGVRSFKLSALYSVIEHTCYDDLPPSMRAFYSMPCPVDHEDYVGVDPMYYPDLDDFLKDRFS
jgi:hypothetical protein